MHRIPFFFFHSLYSIPVTRLSRFSAKAKFTRNNLVCVHQHFTTVSLSLLSSPLLRISSRDR